MPPGELNLEGAVRTLKRGGVVLLATDTLPGFHCRADREDAVQRVTRAKGRKQGKPLLVLAGSLDQARSICTPWTVRQQTICEACWPGPFSLILPAAKNLAPSVLAGSANVAIRIPGHRELRRLLLMVGFPLVSTSVNQQGQEPLQDLGEAWLAFGPQVDGFGLLVGDRSTGQPSALVDLTGTRPHVLRPGPVAFPELCL